MKKRHTTELQRYSWDRHGGMLHAGTDTMPFPPTQRDLEKAEAAWRRWRRQYLKENPDSRRAPIGRGPVMAGSTCVHPIGRPAQRCCAWFNARGKITTMSCEGIDE